MIIMTHGKFGTLSSSNEYYATEKVFSYFTDENCPSLKGKPRLFLFQACRGENFDEGHVMKIKKEMKYTLRRVPFGIENNIQRDANPEKNEKDEAFDSLHEPFNHPDFLIVRSTMPNYVSFRDPIRGSWFIQNLCNELDVNGLYEDILTLLTNVNLAVQEHEANPGKEKQILTISSMLTKIMVLDIKPRKLRKWKKWIDIF